ncbi:MAG: polysaccharide pyruvyl transferase family protein [Bacteroidales bacterium]|nr:polysaccharide pyruvyl transferase family protein [Bacteroidales bacterium]
MTKIGILTYHACFNYGACLQAYALQSVVRQKYLDCKIIDFQTKNFIDINHPFCRYPKHIKEIIKNVTRVPYYFQLKERTNNFNDFIQKELPITRRCSTEEDVKSIAEEFDCIICGSDQTWNLDPAIRYESPVYYLNFPKKQRRITYATSFGSWVDKFTTRQDELLPWIKEFDALSMREESGVNLLKELGLSCEWVLDPTLLLTDNEYNKIAREKLIAEPYVLLFSWDGASEAVELAKIIAKKLNYKLFYIVPPPRAMFSGIKRKLDVGPKEFLSLVKHASFVVTNSFHGTVFSTIFQKPFVSAIKNNADPRRASLMKQFGLSDHLVSPQTLDLDSIFNTNFAKVESNIQPLREHSLQYLYSAIEGK